MKNKYLFPVLVFCISILIYSVTLSRDVQPIDSGELAAVQYSFGIAHPTGYPLYTLLGYLWSRIQIFESIIFQLNFLSAICCSVANVFIVLGMYEILSMNTTEKTLTTNKKSIKIQEKTPAIPDLLLWISAVTGAGMLAFSRTYWLQSTGVEVYALHILLISAALFIFIKLYKTEIPTPKHWISSGIIFGLCFTNHLTSILLIPGIAFLLWKYKNKVRITLKALGTLIGSAGVIFIVFYSILFIRATSNPTFNWGNPSTIEKIWRHITGKQYQDWMFSSGDVATENLEMFITTFAVEFSLIGLAFFIGGIFYFFKKNQAIGWFLLILFLTTVFYSINYDIKDLLPYFLLAYIASGFFMAGTMLWIFNSIDLFRNKPTTAVAALGIPLFVFSFNLSPVDQSEKYYIGDYTKEALASLEKNSLLITYQWDILISPSYYFQKVEKLNPDIMIIDKELLRRTWYYDQLVNWYPGLFDGVEKERDDFLKELQRFENKEKINPAVIQQAFEIMITKLIDEQQKKRTIYIAAEIVSNEIKKGYDVKLPAGKKLVPDLCFYRLVSKPDYLPIPKQLTTDIRFPLQEDIYTKSIKSSLLTVMSDRIEYELSLGKQEDAKSTYLRMKSIKEDIPPPPGLQKENSLSED